MRPTELCILVQVGVVEVRAFKMGCG
jgi:hypothetical protein